MALADVPEAPGVLAYRLRKVEEEAAEIRREKANAKDMERIDAQLELKADVADVALIANEMRGLRRVLIQFMAAISGSAILFSFTVLQILVHK